MELGLGSVSVLYIPDGLQALLMDDKVWSLRGCMCMCMCMWCAGIVVNIGPLTLYRTLFVFSSHPGCWFKQ